MNLAQSESQFYSTIARVSVAQIFRSAGYKSAQNGALKTLSDITGRYLRAIGESAAASANSGGRNECNLVDIVAALEDLGSVRGFVEAYKSEKSHCMISSSVLNEIMEFVSWNEESPFAQPMPEKRWPELKKSGNEMGLSHVPRWLPEMPVTSGIGVRLGIETGKEVTGKENSDELLGGEESKARKGGSEKRKGFDLPEKRGKVKFKMGMRKAMAGGVGNRGCGMDMEVRNGGVFSRSGNGKRIL